MSTKRRIATCECNVCHAIIPKTEASPRQTTRKSGAVGWGWGVSQRTDGSGGRRSISSPRNLYKTETVWICDCCLADERAINRVVRLAVVIITVLVGIAVHASSHGTVATLVGLLTTFWGWVVLVALFGLCCAIVRAWQNMSADQ